LRAQVMVLEIFISQIGLSPRYLLRKVLLNI